MGLQENAVTHNKGNPFPGKKPGRFFQGFCAKPRDLAYFLQVEEGKGPLILLQARGKTAHVVPVILSLCQQGLRKAVKEFAVAVRTQREPQGSEGDEVGPSRIRHDHRDSPFLRGPPYMVAQHRCGAGRIGSNHKNDLRPFQV